jgi:hypothetical protein
MIAGACIAAVLSLSAAAAAQTSSQTPTQSPVQSGTPGASQQTAHPSSPQTETQVTVIGCVTRESGSEFTLTKATTSSMSATASPGASGTATAGTSGRAGVSAGVGSEGVKAGAEVSAVGASGAATRTGSAGSMTTYSLTGDRERDLEKFVDQRVEIVGRVEHAAAAAAGLSTTGASAPGAGNDGRRSETARPDGEAQARSAGAPAQTQPAHEPRLTVVSFKPVPGGGC